MERIAMGTTLSFFVSTVAILLPLFVSHTTSDQSSHIEAFLSCLNHSIFDQTLFNTPNSPFFHDMLNSRIHNKRFKTPSTPKPLAIVTPHDEAQVQTTVTCAKFAGGIQLRIRSGGHDYEGFSYTSEVPFVILDMWPLHNVDVDVEGGTAWVQAGATLGQLYYRIQEKSQAHAFPAGICISLGAGGHFSGGGYGNLMRKYGLSVDNIIDARLVDTNGNCLDRKSMGEDLFWAIRGGGGASFGVVVSWKIKLVPVTPQVTVFNVKRTLEQGATDVVYKWQEVAPELHEDLFIRVQPVVVDGPKGSGKKTVQVSFIGQFLGQSERLLGLMKESFPELGLQKSDCIEMPWVNTTLFWNNFPIGTPLTKLLETPKEPQAKYFKSKSDYVKKPIPKEGLESIWKKLTEGEKMVMQWNPYGGKMRQVSPNDTPFPHRAGNLFMIQYFLAWHEDGEDAIDKHMNFSRSMYEFMTPYVSNSPREAFLNYRDRDIGANPSNGTCMDVARTYGSKYFKENFDKLVSVKTRVDPQNFFRYEQSIPPSSY